MPARRLGTWKLAYADFLTALMAFFLLLWLVSGVSPDARGDIADFFNNGQTASASTLVDIRPNETQRLYNLLSSDAALQSTEDNIVLSRQTNGVRIDLIDSEARPLFAMNESGFTPAGEQLMQNVGHSLSPLTVPLTIEGHTDAFPSQDSERSNWDISSERANAARRALTAAGITDSRIRAVTGLAATRPLDAGQPHLPANRRISILLQVDG
ncbi:hypothetical protein HY3_08725 [Hyphomonas pacifica]|uniref:Uncharacterized protein n=1 Tax=Hyphomonas pacifica TaxID=1280941 RepID=A0A062U9T8_9PROT|nr:hypothetical protein HY2_07200 [Hyphomonas pacifica]RAN35373.1 hypothetical protein HY3_08725 [Hyphomonas pacifica]